MKIFIICSKDFYGKIPAIRRKLEKLGHEITLPSCYECPDKEKEMYQKSKKEYASWKGQLLRHSRSVIEDMDAVLVLNYKKGNFKNYIGDATFLEIYDAFTMGKAIFLFNGYPSNRNLDEIKGMAPILLHQKLQKINEYHKITLDIVRFQPGEICDIQLGEVVGPLFERTKDGKVRISSNVVGFSLVTIDGEEKIALVCEDDIIKSLYYKSKTNHFIDILPEVFEKIIEVDKLDMPIEKEVSGNKEDIIWKILRKVR